MKKFLKILALALSTIMLSTCFIGCNPGDDDSGEESLTYVSMRINPEIEIVVDEEGVVVAVNAINEDGETVLAELTLVGMTAEDAAEAFTDIATELGYIDVTATENALYISADCDVESIAQNLQDKMTNKVNKYFEENGIYGKVKLENFEELQALATEWNIDLKEAKVVVRIQALYPEMTVDEILALTFEEKLALIKDNVKNNGIPVQMQEEYNRLVEALNTQFDEMFNIEDMIKDYKEQLASSSLTETQKQFIEGMLDSLETQLQTLKQNYKTALEQIKQQIKLELDEVKQNIELEVDRRREENRQKLEDHKRDFEGRKEQVKQDIKDWQEGKRP